MDLTGEGLKITGRDASDLARVATVVANGLRKTSVLSLVLKEPTDEERNSAATIAAELAPEEGDAGSEKLVTLDHGKFQAVYAVAEAALANTQAVMTHMCTPSVPDGFYPEWRADALRALATTAQVSEYVFPYSSVSTT